MPASEFDAIVIGTGFGGAVAACRLAQAGLHICVLERGRRYESSEPVDGQEPSSDFPQLPPSDRVAPDLARFRFGVDQGLWDIRDLGDLHAVQVAGYGGGSLVYANVHLRAPSEVFASGWPAGYGATELEPYYDLVAGMLDLLPATAAPFSLIKTEQLRKSAAALGREAAFFHPPLAVSFEARKNRFGQAQGGCRACGECDAGCRFRAKNTLDLNYLSVVDQRSNADVRTQVEALLVSELGADARPLRYEVTYRDHLQGREHGRIRAKAVFVCAGAINSTALLLESKRVGRAQVPDRRGRGLPRLDRHDQLGQNYFLNADALGMVYDARLPAEAGGEAASRVLKPTVGPVITAAVVHRDAKSWFLLQDGGYSKALARHVGVLRSPLLLRRNRFEHVASDIPVIAASLPGALDRPLPRATEPSALGDAGGIQGGPLLSAIDGLLALAQDRDLDRAMPPMLRESLATLQSELGELRDRELSALSEAIRDALAEQTAHQWARMLVLWLQKRPPRVLVALMRPLARLLYRMVAPRQKILAATVAALDERYGIAQPQAFARRAVRSLLGFTDERAHSEHGMVLLGMGRDDTSGIIAQDEGGNLQVKIDFEHDTRVRVYGVQERLMRDVAATLRGKLRVNPFWAYDRKPVTVHGQGGCRMADEPRHGVTDGHGQVHGHEGLFVLDGSILPRPVGVNPASTIAAVAERNVAWFITQSDKPDNYLSEDRRHAAAWRRQAQGWLDDPDARVRLTPPDVRSEEPVTQPIGVRFTERMSGYHSLLAEDPRRDDDAYDAAEIAGRPAQPIELELTATVRDISNFIRDRRHRMAAQAKLKVALDGRVRELTALGRVILFRARVPNAKEDSMNYRLALFEGRRRVGTLRGYKRVHDDPGPDAWRDTTTLFVRLDLGGVRTCGALHVAMNRFFFQQLPSFEVLGTQDPARVLWAVSTFVAYFFGALQRIYLPQLDKVVNALEEIGLR